MTNSIQEAWQCDRIVNGLVNFLTPDKQEIQFPVNELTESHQKMLSLLFSKRISNWNETGDAPIVARVNATKSEKGEYLKFAIIAFEVQND